jgi:ABC-type nickel/cobalt efflux system permease component RcnA
MMILPPSHAQTLHQRHRLSGRERWMIGGVLGLLATGAALLVISLATAGHKSGHGCVSVGLAYSTGGAQVYRCGASARQLCQSVNRPGGTTGGAARSLTIECRKAGLPVG